MEADPDRSSAFYGGRQLANVNDRHRPLQIRAIYSEFRLFKAHIVALPSRKLLIMTVHNALPSFVFVLFMVRRDNIREQDCEH